MNRAASRPLGCFRTESVLFAAVAVALAVLIVLPLLFLLSASVLDKTGLTLAHFAAALFGASNLRAISNSLILGSATALISLCLGVPLAWATSRTNMAGKHLATTTVLMSYVTPPFVTAIAFVNLFGPNGGLYNVLVRDVLDLPSMTFNVFSMAGLIVVTVPHTFPFVYFLAAGAMRSIDGSMEEAAQIAGASRWRTARSITIPLVAPAVLGGALLAFVNAIALFGSQAIIGIPARIYTLPTRIYALLDYPPQYGVASAVSLLLVALTVAALSLQRAFLARRSYATISGKGNRPVLIDLGRARRLPLAFIFVVFVVCVAAPYTTLIAGSFSKSWSLSFWTNPTFDNYRFILFDYDVTRRALGNSFILATVSATVVVALGFLIGWIDLRTALPGRRILDYVALVPLGIPGIVMAIALLQFWLRMPVPLYGTLAILLLAYIARFIPLGVRSAHSALRQIDPTLEEAARVLGAGWSMTMRLITLPLVRRSMLAGWLLVFVPAIQELSASVLLFSSDSITLAVAVLNLYETGKTEAVAALSVINILVVGLVALAAGRLGFAREQNTMA